MSSFAELGVEDIASFRFCIFYRCMEVRVMFDHVTCVYNNMRRKLAALGGRFRG